MLSSLHTRLGKATLLSLSATLILAGAWFNTPASATTPDDSANATVNATTDDNPTGPGEHTAEWDYEPALLAAVNPNDPGDAPSDSAQLFAQVAEACVDGEHTEQGCEPADQEQSFASGFHTICPPPANDLEPRRCFRVIHERVQHSNPTVTTSNKTPPELDTYFANAKAASQVTALLEEDPEEYELQGRACPGGEVFHPATLAYSPKYDRAVCVSLVHLTQQIPETLSPVTCPKSYQPSFHRPTQTVMCTYIADTRPATATQWSLSEETAEAAEEGTTTPFNDRTDCVIPVETVDDWDTHSDRLGCIEHPIEEQPTGDATDPVADPPPLAEPQVASYAVAVTAGDPTALQLCWLMHPDEVHGSGEQCELGDPASQADNPADNPGETDPENAAANLQRGVTIPTVPALMLGSGHPAPANANANATASPAATIAPTPVPGNGTVRVAVNGEESPVLVGVNNGSSVVAFDGFEPGVHTVELTFEHPHAQVATQTMVVHVLVAEAFTDPAGSPQLRIGLGVALGVAALGSLWLIFGARLRSR